MPIYLNSLRMTLTPQSEKNFSIPIRETLTPLNGKKYLELSIGIKKPTPLPPDVMASKTPWDTVNKNKTMAKI